MAMALVQCPDCRKRVSHKAKVCVKCGLPLEGYTGVFSWGVLLTSICRFIIALNGLGLGYVCFVAIPYNPSWESAKTYIDAFGTFKTHIIFGAVSALIGIYFVISGFGKFSSHVLIKTEDIDLPVRLRAWQLFGLILTVIWLLCMIVHYENLYDNASFSDYQSGDAVFWYKAHLAHFEKIPVHPQRFKAEQALYKSYADISNRSEEDLKSSGFMPTLKKALAWDVVFSNTISPLILIWSLALVLSGTFGTNTGLRKRSQGEVRSFASKFKEGAVDWFRSITKQQLIIASIIGFFTILVVGSTLFVTYKFPQIRQENQKKARENWKDKHNWRNASDVLQATEDWKNIGSLQVKAGETVRVHASGQWSIGGVYKLHGPDGRKKALVTKKRPMPKANYGCLIAKIGSQYQEIGSSKEFLAKDSGKLLFRINDGRIDNNKGQCSISIEVLQKD